MSKPVIDLESVAGPSNPETTSRFVSPSPYVLSAPFKGIAMPGFNPRSTPFAPATWGMNIAQYKQKRSDTIPGPPVVHEHIALKNPTCNY
jgi:hypothetical protein